MYMIASVALFLAVSAAFLYWRYVYFFRNPDRKTPEGDNIVSPADGAVVYSKRLGPGEPVCTVKQGVVARIEDITKEVIDGEKILIGIFMSPFDVHYNRAPMTGAVERIQHHPAKTRNRHMWPMHWRIMVGRSPFYAQATHIIENERTVTRFRGMFRGKETVCYVIQIAGQSVNGIDSYFSPGDAVRKGQIFGMIRIGSQVDLVVADPGAASVKVKAGDRVRAGETILIE